MKRAGVLLCVLAFAARADDTGITTARLIEHAADAYVLEADVAPAQVAALNAPVLPKGLVADARPTPRRVEAGRVSARDV